MKQTLRSKRTVLLIVGLLFVIAGMIYLIPGQGGQSGYFGVISEEDLIQVPLDELPSDALFITEARRSFARGEMRLIIPSIEVDSLIGESTLPDLLTKMPGLFEFSQLPGEGDVNVSVAGHRDIYGKEFFYLDKVASGDYLYVIHDQIVFRYLYKDTTIVHPRDWDVIRPQGMSCLTLVTCDPIGTTLNRLIVRAQLIDYQPLSDDYDFAANRAD